MSTEISFILEENKFLIMKNKELQHGVNKQKYINNKYKKLEKLLADRK